MRTPVETETLSRRSRPYLLLWLLPYLVFSVASDSFHSHDWSRVTNVAVASASGSGHTARAAAPPAALVSGGECFACDWAANSASHVAVAVPATVTSSVLTSPTPFLFSLHASPAWSWHIRGPPVL